MHDVIDMLGVQCPTVRNELRRIVSNDPEHIELAHDTNQRAVRRSRRQQGMR
jgi:hypothetical protein